MHNMNFYDRFYTAHYLWMLRVENDKKFELNNYFAFSAIFPVCITVFVNILMSTMLLNELELIPSIPFGNVGFNMAVLFILFMVHYCVYILPGRYRILAPQLKHKINNTQRLIQHVIAPYAFAFLILLPIIVIIM